MQNSLFYSKKESFYKQLFFNKIHQTKYSRKATIPDTTLSISLAIEFLPYSFETSPYSH